VSEVIGMGVGGQSNDGKDCEYESVVVGDNWAAFYLHLRSCARISLKFDETEAHIAETSHLGHTAQSVFLKIVSGSSQLRL
jgi:hypothetical protein